MTAGHAEASLAIPRVLYTTELLEAVLVHVDLRDLFRICTVCKAFNDTIAGSLKLERKIFLKPITQPHIDLLPTSTIPGLKVYLERHHDHIWKWVSKFSVNYQPGATQFGSKARSMQLSRHPITELRAYPNFCNYCLVERHGRDFIRPNGITLGDICDVSEQILLDREACPKPFASCAKGDDVRRRVGHFQSQWFQLPDDHPLRT